jgi:hypothetical protein
MSTSPNTRPQVIRDIGLGGITAWPDMWELRDPKAARALVKAVRHHGASLRLITVRARTPSMLGYELIDGLTELLAAKILKTGAIRAIVLPEKYTSSAARDRREKSRRAHARAAALSSIAQRGEEK